MSLHPIRALSVARTALILLADPALWKAITADVIEWAKFLKERHNGTGKISISLNLRGDRYMGYRVGAEGADHRAEDGQ